MDYISCLKELETLPKGYISKKKIKGKTYYYLQYFDNEKIKSKYIKANELPVIEQQLKRREELEKIIKQFNSKKLRTLSNRDKDFTGYLMVGDKIGAKFTHGILEYRNDSICPLYVLRTSDIVSFLSSRVLDLSRPNSRVLLRMLGIQEKKEEYISLYSHGLCISDNYWFKAAGSKLKYADVCFTNDLYSDLALTGRIYQLPSQGSPSPELTNIGSFEKCWKRINNQWWLYKKGDEDQLFSELFSSKLAVLLDIPTAVYEYDSGYVRTLNFADEYNFEPMFALMDNNESYNDVFDLLVKHNISIAEQYIKLMLFDVITYNVDRHNQNYGLLRDKNNGKIISLAPNFDNNLSLLAYNKTLDQDPNKDKLIEMFLSFVKTNEKAKEMFSNIKIKEISSDDLEKIIDGIPIKKDSDKIIHFILNRIKYLKSKQ